MKFLSPVGLGCHLAAIALTITFLAFTPATTHAQTYTVLYNFTGGADGLQPQGTPIVDNQGNLWGVTSAGGDLTCSVNNSGCGVVFELKADGTFLVLHTFEGGFDGATAVAGLLRDKNGNLFGTTANGGDTTCAANPNGCGTIYRISSTGSYKVLHSFTGVGQGVSPDSELIQDEQGNLWGTTPTGGYTGNPACFGGCGTIFKLGSKFKLTTYEFRGTPNSGSEPLSGVVTGPAGVLYGTTDSGGTKNFGTAFKFNTTTGQITTLYNFTGPADPRQILSSNSKIYGLAGSHGQGSGGTLYQLDQAGFQILSNFEGEPSPQGNLLRDGSGNFYGQTGPFTGDFTGVIYKVDASGNLTTLHSFAGFPIDGDTGTGLVWDGHSSFYGFTSGGGSTGAGTIFKVTP